jgi:hypothetical protein
VTARPADALELHGHDHAHEIRSPQGLRAPPITRRPSHRFGYSTCTPLVPAPRRCLIR